jgi:hypothetical protein
VLRPDDRVARAREPFRERIVMNVMKKTHGVRWGMALVVCLVALGLFGGVEAGKKTTATITGTIQPAETRHDKVILVFIQDAEQGDFVVLRGTEVAKELTKLVGQQIRATGYVGKALREKNFDTYIDILEYEIVQVARVD